MANSAFLGGIGQALSNREFRLFWASNAFSTLGRWVYRTSVAWLTWELTESESWLGIIAFADIFPMVVLSLFAGAISDRIGYMRVIKASQLALILVSAVFSVLIFLDLLTIELVLALSICHGIIEAMSTPPRISMVNALVRREDLPAAVALNSATFNACRVLGPAIAGGLLALSISGDVVFALAMLTFIQFYVVTFFVRAEGAGGEGRISIELVRDMWDGVIYAWHDTGIRFLMLLLAATGLLVRPFMELAPGFAAKVFERGPDGLAIILSSIGAGAMVASLWLAHRGRSEGLTVLVTGSFAAQVAALLAFTVSGNILFAALFLVLVGFFMLITGVGAQTLIQNSVAAEMRARAISLFILLSWGLPAIGALVMGWAATYFGLQATIAFGAALGGLVWLWARVAGKFFAPRLEANAASKK
jgi:MFS family permease